MVNRTRTTILLDRKVQWTLAGRALLLWTLHSFLVIGMLAIFQLAFGGIFRPWSELWSSLWPVAASVLVSMLVMVPFFIRDSFKLSHRFVGPILRIRRGLRELAEGKPYEVVKLREGDFWPELAEELNKAVAVLTQDRDNVNLDETENEQPGSEIEEASEEESPVESEAPVLQNG